MEMLIVFEGPDRVGKTTQADLVQSALAELHPHTQVHRRRFPSRIGAIGRVVDKHLSGEHVLDPRAFHLICCADRWQYHDDMMSSLIEGDIIILDRYLYSGIVYSSALGLNMPWCVEGNVGLVEPDVIVYMEVDEETQQSRMGDDRELYDDRQIQKRVKELYTSLFDSMEGNEGGPVILRVNGKGNRDEITHTIISQLPPARSLRFYRGL